VTFADTPQLPSMSDNENMRSLLLTAALLALTGCGARFHTAAGGAGGAAGDSSAGGAGADSSSSSSSGSGGGGLGTTEGYAFRRPITVSALAAMPMDYSVFVKLDHQQLVTDSKATAGGEDVRLFFDDGGAQTELHRVIDPSDAWGRDATMLWFRTKEPIAAMSSDDRYWLYYGDPTAGSPPSDPNQVFAFFDGFDDGVVDPSWTFDAIGTVSSSSLEENNGVLRITASTDFLWGAADSTVLLHRQVSGGFVADIQLVASGGTFSAWGRVGAVMVRASLVPGSRMHVSTAFSASATWGCIFRTVDNAAADGSSVGSTSAMPTYVRLGRGDGYTQAYSSSDGLAWNVVGAEVVTSPLLPDPAALGIAFANEDLSGEGWVEVDWYRQRIAVDPEEPEVLLGAEQVAP